MGRIIICPFNSRKAVKKRWRLCEARRLAELLLSTINSKFFFFNGLLFCCPVSLVNWIAVYFVPRGTKSWPGIIRSLSIDDALTATIYCPSNFLSNYPLKPTDQSSKILCFLNGSVIQRRWAFFSRHRAKEIKLKSRSPKKWKRFGAPCAYSLPPRRGVERNFPQSAHRA